MVVVAAAGNGEFLNVKGWTELPGNLASPACIPTDNLISVGAVRPNGDPNMAA